MADNSFIKTIEQSIHDNWKRNAISDYKGDSFTYKDVGIIIKHYHDEFKAQGIERGDRIALCGQNSARWVIAFMAVVSYGAVAVPILKDFRPEQIYHILEHSESRILFSGRNVRKLLDPKAMPGHVTMLKIEDITLPEDGNADFNASDLHFQAETTEDDLCVLNYTSGTTGFSKGVMLPYRALLSNLQHGYEEFGNILTPGTRILSILPMAHMYGLMMDHIWGFAMGCHITVLMRQPSPSIVEQAFNDIRPRILMTVPMVLEKMTRAKILPLMAGKKKKLMCAIPFLGKLMKSYVLRQAKNIFGGNIYQVVVGGAALNGQIEDFLQSINFPVTVAYGATECAPLISVSDYKRHKRKSCGEIVKNMTVMIDSTDPKNIPGEVICTGKNVMLGYYKNPDVTTETLSAKAEHTLLPQSPYPWYHTGDMGVLDSDGCLFIKGRKKSMLLGPSGQNIYPEEIEQLLNNKPYIIESLIVHREDRLVAFIYPDFDKAYARGLNNKALLTILKNNLREVNQQRPQYEFVSQIEICDHPFEKTAKQSIKRYLYS